MHSKILEVGLQGLCTMRAYNTFQLSQRRLYYNTIVPHLYCFDNNVCKSRASRHLNLQSIVLKYGNVARHDITEWYMKNHIFKLFFVI